MTLASICLGLSLIAAMPASDPVAPPDPALSYRELREKAGRSPEDQVRLALWCEVHNLPAERLHHLTLAVLADPRNAIARSLMGLVARDGRWLRPETVADKLKADPERSASLAEYEQKRQKAAHTAEAQWALGVWAEEHGLVEQAKAHLTAVTRLDPARDAAWKRLGYKKHDGRWVTDAQLAREKAEAEAQKLADRKWKPLLEKSKAMLDQPSKHAEAEAALEGVSDPRAVPMIGRVFAATEAGQPLAARLLGQIDAPASSRALAFLAVFANSAEARRISAETLRGRDPREYADGLIALIRKPIKYEVRPVGGPGSPGQLFIEGEKANFKRLYEPGSAFMPGDMVAIDQFGQPVVRRVLSGYAYSRRGNPFNPRLLTGVAATYQDYYGQTGMSFGDLATPAMVSLANGGVTAAQLAALKAGRPTASSGHTTGATVAATNPVPFGYGLFGTPYGVGPRDFATMTQAEVPLDQAIAETQRSLATSQQQLDADVATLQAQNRSANEVNDRVVGLLNNVSGQGLPADRPTWDRWWINILGYAPIAAQTTTTPTPTIVEVVPSGYQPQVIPSNIINSSIGVNGISCFGAGTPVRTVDGVRPIESLAPGDLVLTQSTTSGALDYRPILVVHHNPPSPTFKVKLAGEPIISSHFHRFWVAGRGWVMARDLKVGDPIRTLGGVSSVEAIETAKVQLVFNLDVAEDADFFAGNLGALVHDNTLPDPRLVPFDALPKADELARRPSSK